MIPSDDKHNTLSDFLVIKKVGFIVAMVKISSPIERLGFHRKKKKHNPQMEGTNVHETSHDNLTSSNVAVVFFVFLRNVSFPGSS